MKTRESFNLDDLFVLSRRFLSIHQETYQRKILNDFGISSRLNILVGQRGVGKTTFLIQKLLDSAQNNPFSTEILYIPTDHFLIGNTSLYEIADAFYLNGGKLLALDEIHKYKNWSKEIKSLFDTFPDLGIMVSGSSGLEIRTSTHDLSRRALLTNMPGYSFREYLEFEHSLSLPYFSLQEITAHHTQITHEILAMLASYPFKILQEFKHYLQTGYYPYHRQFNNAKNYYITLEQNLHYTLESDLPTIHPSLTGHSIRKIKQLMSFIANSVPFTANFSKLKHLIDVGDERTLKTYLHYLHECGLIRLCMKSSSKLLKIESPEKIYLHNPNQMHALSPSNPNSGTLRELFFLSMISFEHDISIPAQGDFLIDNAYLFEIGGPNKESTQIQNIEKSFLGIDGIEHGVKNTIPLWLFGFIY